MQRVGRDVGLRDTRDDAIDVLIGECVKERLVELCTDAVPCRLRIAGDTCFDSSVVSCLGAMASRGGVTQNAQAGLLSDKQPVALAGSVLVKPCQALLGGERLHVEGDMGVEHIVVVDVGEPRQVAQQRITNGRIRHTVVLKHSSSRVSVLSTWKWDNSSHLFYGFPTRNEGGSDACHLERKGFG